MKKLSADLVEKLEMLGLTDISKFNNCYTKFLYPNDLQISKDNYGRAKRTEYLISQLGLDNRPIIDEASDFFKMPRPTLPDCKKAVVCLTHDVDLRMLNWQRQFWQYRLRNDYDGMTKMDKTIKTWSSWKKNKYDPIHAFDRWMELEETYGFRSTFFFLSLKKALSREGRLYSVYNKDVKKVVRALHDGGWEIGLHGAYYGHLDSKNLAEQRERLENCLGYEVKGCRHHYLRVIFPISWQIYKEAGFKYSTNVGWSGFNGFRSGTCRPYQPPQGNGLWEVPFQIMDSPFLRSDEELYSTFQEYLKKTKEVLGVLVIIVHSNHYNEGVAPYVYSFYSKVLEFLSSDEEVSVMPI